MLLHAVGSGAEGRTRDALDGRMRAPGTSRTSPSAPRCWKRAISGATARCSTICARQFWSDIAAGTGQDFVEAKLAERDARHRRQGESRYLVEPNVKEGKGGLRDLQTLYWIGKYLYRVDDPAALVHHGVFTRDEFKTFQKRRSVPVGRALPSALPAGPRRGATVVRRAAASWPRRLGFAGESSAPRRRSASCAPISWSPRMSAISRASSARRSKNKTARPRPPLSRLLPGFLKPRTLQRRFLRRERAAECSAKPRFDAIRST